MKKLRRYGKAPFSVAVLHGGPGAGGEMGPVARELAGRWGVLEPIQTAMSLDGQVEELMGVLKKEAKAPVILVGFSWGAWLGFIVAARYPEIVRKLILVGSGPFEEKYAEGIQDIRLKRLSEEERAEFESVANCLADTGGKGKDRLIMRLGQLAAKADSYEPIGGECETIEFNGDIFLNVWADASKLRSSGELIRLGNHIECPVIAIHGDYDPHPAEGVEKPLSAVLKDFRFVLLNNCGHKPWVERQAKEEFFRVLKEQLRI